MPHRTAAFGDFLHRNPHWRWIVIGLVVLGVVMYETIEHQVLFRGEEIEPDFIRDTIFYGIVSVFAAAFIVNRLERLSLAYQQSRSSYDSLQNLVEQLRDAGDYLEASAIYLQAVRANLSIDGARLLVYDQGEERFFQAGSWARDGRKLPASNPQPEKVNCSLHEADKRAREFSLRACTCAGNGQEQHWPFRYCLPLIGSDEPEAILHLFHDNALALSNEQETLMKDMASEFVFTLERTQLQETLEQHKASQNTVHQRIARDMHATLGHNLAYLRMKLDQVSVDYLGDDETLSSDLIQLRETANESYQQMRDLLVALTPEKTPNLRAIMRKYAQRIGDRAGFKLEIHFTGEPRPLSAVVLRQVVLIVREALGNIEKHARAEHVVINTDWQAQGLRIHIMDDGRGFNPDEPISAEHLGLRFMQERTHEMKGELIISSREGSGTQISLLVPYQSVDGEDSYVQSDQYPGG